MAKIFNSVKGSRVRRNVFNLSHENKLSCNMGELIPIFLQEVVPGDTFRVDSEIMMRFAPLLAPVMHRINVYVHFFYVPNRLVYSGWERFIAGDENEVLPYINSNSAVASIPTIFNHGSLADYMGVPDLSGNIGDGIRINSLPFRAYQLIYNEYYRDQDLSPEVMFSRVGGAETEYVLLLKRYRAWEKDYFTSARPWAQKGDAVQLPVAEGSLVYNPSGLGSRVRDKLDGSIVSTSGDLVDALGMVRHDVSGADVDIDVSNSHDVSVTAGTINELRRAFQLQKWLERNARTGTRYTELLLAHFGVKSSDSRLQRPEYLGGGRQAVQISEVLQTSEATATSPLGEMAGHGISVGRSNRFKRFFEEHGYVLGIMSVVPRTAYYQGLPRHLQKSDKFDFFWPEFEHIGEQAIKNSEIYFSGEQNLDNDTFGYAPRYSEYKYVPTQVHGDFRNTLEFWHLGRKFDSLPQLNNTFVESNPSNRIFNVTDSDVHKLWVQVYHNVKAIRPMSVFGEPGLIDH